MPNLVLLAGVPGCGKSTWAKTLFDLKYAVVSSDKIRKELAGTLKEAHGNQIKPWDLFYQRIAEDLTHGVDVMADATFLTPLHRDRAREVADQTGARLHLVLFKNLVAAYCRNRERDDDARVPDEVMADMEQLYYDTLSRLPTESYDSVTLIDKFDASLP